MRKRKTETLPDAESDIRRAIGILAKYLTERDQIKPIGPDSEIYWLAQEFKDNGQADQEAHG